MIPERLKATIVTGVIYVGRPDNNLLLSILTILSGFPSRSDTGNLGLVMDRLMERDLEERPSAEQALQMLILTGATEATQPDDSAAMTTGTQPLELTHPVAVH